MKIRLSFILFFISTLTFSQEILLSQEVEENIQQPMRGPNLKHFTMGYIGIGLPVFTNEDFIYTKFGASSTFDFGIRYKRKLSNTFALGLDLGMNFSDYVIKQETGKSIPDTVINDKEKFQINTLNGSAYFRVNIGRRGNYIGNYFDLGAYYGWNMVKKHKTINENQEDEKVKLVTSQLKYIDDFSSGLLARVGISRFALTARYRLSDIFISSYFLPELPRLTIGLELGVFKK
jgi:hypothetical protein